ncbi:hypothetical protein NDU88_000143 [Pleurodeles waltl]|uniref:Uncharacterized protein n=1 Tax=Pleurodeles waltl TaxID=8319 RepID=A0AAV7L777_PLEWA|nr:hypothetical protein NDU88_000143 [Pleurodeles waltl]
MEGRVTKPSGSRHGRLPLQSGQRTGPRMEGRVTKSSGSRHGRLPLQSGQRTGPRMEGRVTYPPDSAPRVFLQPGLAAGSAAEAGARLNVT